MPIPDTPLAGETEAALERLVHHTLEIMCFAEAERMPSPLPAGGAGRAILARIDFSGGCSGSLQLEVEPAGARALAASFLASNPRIARLPAKAAKPCRNSRACCVGA
jgi:hypothetical protein